MDSEPTFEEIDELSRELNALFASLLAKIAHVDNRLRSVSLDYMYGNLSEDLYLGQMQEIGKRIAQFKSMLFTLRDADSNIR